MAAKQHTVPEPAPQGSVFIDIRALVRDYGLSRTTVFRLCEEGTLPQPVRTGRGRTCKRLWRRTDIEAAMDMLPREKPHVMA